MELIKHVLRVTSPGEELDTLTSSASKLHQLLQGNRRVSRFPAYCILEADVGIITGKVSETV